MLDIRDLKRLDRDDLLRLIGLETRREASDWLMPAAGLFGAGVLLGLGLGLLLAPRPGRELRGELKDRLRTGAEDLARRVQVPGEASGHA